MSKDLLKKYDISYPPCGFEVGPGWYDLLDKLFETMISMGWDKNLRQVKEKFGSLRVYVGKTDSGIYNLINKTEKQSEKICETCGAPGIIRAPEDRYWLRCSCDSCFIKIINRKL